MILTDGYDEYGNKYLVHPDSLIPFKGERIPDWQLLLDTVEHIHRTCMPDHIYISWDFAYSQKGWILVEGNWGQFIAQQTSTKIGYKKQFDQFLIGKAYDKTKQLLDEQHSN